MKTMILFMMVFSAISSLNAQDRNEGKKIQNAIRQWAQAADAQNADAAAIHLDTHYRIVMNRLMGSPDVRTVDKETYLQMLRDKKLGGDARTLKFKRIKVVGSTASVELEMTGKKLHFQSLIQLIQDAEGNWKLVSDVPQITAI